MTAMNHIHYLAEKIGPRGSTTREERKAAEYARQVLSQAGLEPHWESFVSARSTWYPAVLYSGLVLVAELLFLGTGVPGALTALVLTSAALFSMLLELSLRPNPLRWLLPKADSQNVWAKLHPRRQSRVQVVLLGHLDSHRTPLIFKDDRWTRIFQIFVPAGLISSLALVMLFAIGIISPAPVWRTLSLPFGLVFLGLFALTLQADLSPFSAGANDNASGSAVVLSLAERLQGEPLEHTTVWTVLTGCEEVGCYGAEAFAQTHRQELGGAIWIAVDGVGGEGAVPAYITKETFLLTTHSDPDLVSLAAQVAERNPDLEARPHAFFGAYCEGVIGAKHGFRVLSMVGCRPDGALPEWHRTSDIVSKIDPQIVLKNEEFLLEILREIDSRAGSETGV